MAHVTREVVIGKSISVQHRDSFQLFIARQHEIIPALIHAACHRGFSRLLRFFLRRCSQ
jgi:hypothetical protein